MCRGDDADVGLVTAEGNQNTTANDNLPLQLWRNGIGEHAVEWKRQDDVDIQLSFYDLRLEIDGSTDLPGVVVGINVVVILELTRLASGEVVGEAHLQMLQQIDTGSEVET